MESNSVMGELKRLLVDSGRTFSRFIFDAARAIAAHWPQLIGIFLLGWAGRMGFLWAATVVSDYNPTLAVLILPLAPMSTLLSFVFILRALAPTLPAFAELTETKTRRERLSDDLKVAGKVLLPFLAVYASAGLLRQDASVFLVDSTTDEAYNTTIQNIDWGRADYAPGWTIIAFIVIALAARKAIALLGLVKRHIAWAAVATYLEVLWIMTLANALTMQLDSISEWLTSRRVIATILIWWDGIVTAIREFSSTANAVLDAVSSLLGNLGAIVIIPVAWLTIGAAVYGYQLRSVDLGMSTPEEVTKQIAKMPNPVRRAARQIAEPVTTPVQNTLNAIRKIAVAGILPMVMFCVVFLVANGVQTVVALALRGAIGPGDALRQFALEPYVTMVERGVYFVLVLSLLAAAVNAIVLAQQQSVGASEKLAGAGPEELV